ncbi:hypothetical protein GCM10023339_38340 [Alloalcanivorax gelatiniphagus]
MTVRLAFQLTQHIRDEQLIRSLIEYFDAGCVSKDKYVFNYRVEDKFSDIYSKILPFFLKIVYME